MSAFEQNDNMIDNENVNVADNPDDHGVASVFDPSEPLTTLLDDVAVFVKKYVVLSEAQLAAITLWVAHTHGFEAAEVTPFLAVTSAEMRSGKTRLLEVLETLVRSPWRAVFPSEAVLFRKIARDRPTLLLDEVDGIFGDRAGDHEALRCLLNSGNRVGVTVPRMAGKGSELHIESFPVFCPRALAGLGKLPRTVSDRSVRIALKRRARHESVARFRLREVKGPGEELRGRLAAKVAAVSLNALRDARPEIPDAINDRMQDAVEPLLAIADLAGGEWPDRARKALVTLCGQNDADEDSLGVHALRDARIVFEARRGVDRIASQDLCAALNAMDESPWGDLDKGKGLSVRRLASLLKTFDILSGTIRFGALTAKGYYAADFADAFRRYLGSDAQENVTASQAAPALTKACDGGVSTGNETSQGKPAPALAGDAVTDKEPPEGTGR